MKPGVQTSHAATIDLTLDSDEDEAEATPEPSARPPVDDYSERESASRAYLKAIFPHKTVGQHSPLFVSSNSPPNQLSQWLNDPANSPQRPQEKRPRKQLHASGIAIRTQTQTAQLTALGTWKACQG